MGREYWVQAPARYKSQKDHPHGWHPLKESSCFRTIDTLWAAHLFAASESEFPYPSVSTKFPRSSIAMTRPIACNGSLPIQTGFNRPKTCACTPVVDCLGFGL